jgi:hypothetical protein
MLRKSVCPFLAATVLAMAAAIFVSAFASWAPAAGPPTGRVAAADSGQRAFAPRSASPAPHSITQRQREGTALVDVPGYFKLTGDRATFFPSGSDAHYMGLENLNLERIATAISDIPEQIPWIVSGTITEYRGANYLLVTKAILQNAPANSGRSASSSESTSLSNLGRGF